MYYDLNITFINPWISVWYMSMKHEYDTLTFLYFSISLMYMEKRMRMTPLSGVKFSVHHTEVNDEVNYNE